MFKMKKEGKQNRERGKKERRKYVLTPKIFTVALRQRQAWGTIEDGGHFWQVTSPRELRERH
jgi:hypothetical protein